MTTTLPALSPVVAQICHCNQAATNTELSRAGLQKHHLPLGGSTIGPQEEEDVQQNTPLTSSVRFLKHVLPVVFGLLSMRAMPPFLMLTFLSY